MKLAKMWNEEYGAPDGSLDHQVDVIPSALIPEIQADAYYQAMTDAAEILKRKCQFVAEEMETKISYWGNISEMEAFRKILGKRDSIKI